MAFTENSTVKELLADDRAVAIIEKHMPGVTKHPMIKMASSFSIKSIGEMPGMDTQKDMYDKILAELTALD